MPYAPTDLRSLARAQTVACLRVLTQIVCDIDAPHAARVAACGHILDRGWGKPATTHTGEDGQGPVVVEIVYRNPDEKLKVIEHVVPDQGTGK